MLARHRLLAIVAWVGVALPLLFAGIFGGAYPPIPARVVIMRVLLSIAILCCVGLVISGRRGLALVALAFYVILVMLMLF